MNISHISPSSHSSHLSHTTNHCRLSTAHPDASQHNRHAKRHGHNTNHQHLPPPPLPPLPPPSTMWPGQPQCATMTPQLNGQQLTRPPHLSHQDMTDTREDMAMSEWPTQCDKMAARGQKHGEHNTTDKKKGVGSTTGGVYKVCLLFFHFLSYSNSFLAYHHPPPLPGHHHHPQPPKTSASAHFQEVDLSLAITTPENEPSRSFLGMFSVFTISPFP